MMRAIKSSIRGVYKLEVEGKIIYRLDNGAIGAQENLHRELERKLGSSVLVPEIKIASKDKQ